MLNIWSKTINSLYIHTCSCIHCAPLKIYVNRGHVHHNSMLILVSTLDKTSLALTTPCLRNLPIESLQQRELKKPCDV